MRRIVLRICKRLIGAPRFFDAPQGQRTKTALFVSDTAKNASHNRRSIFISEGVNFYALLLYVLSHSLRIKRGETTLLMCGVPSQ